MRRRGAQGEGLGRGLVSINHQNARGLWPRRIVAGGGVVEEENVAVAVSASVAVAVAGTAATAETAATQQRQQQQSS